MNKITSEKKDTPSDNIKAQPDQGPPPCALCSRPPHPDSYGHSYRPRRAAISVSDGVGSDTSGVSLAEEAKYPGSSRRADSSSLANAQAPMERWEVRDSGGIGVRDVFCGRLLICNEVEPAKAQAFCDAHNASLPSVIKEQPANQDL